MDEGEMGKIPFLPMRWIFKALEGNGLLWLSNYLLALSLTGIMLSFDVRGFVSRNVSVGHALRNFRIFTGCQAGKTGPERLIHLGCASCRVDSIPPSVSGKGLSRITSSWGTARIWRHSGFPPGAGLDGL